MASRSRVPLGLILSSALVAGAGNGISIIAFPWLVLQRNGSAAEASVVALAATLPLLVATLFAGPRWITWAGGGSRCSRICSPRCRWPGSRWWR